MSYILSLQNMNDSELYIYRSNMSTCSMQPVFVCYKGGYKIQNENTNNFILHRIKTLKHQLLAIFRW